MEKMGKNMEKHGKTWKKKPWEKWKNIGNHGKKHLFYEVVGFFTLCVRLILFF